MTHTPGPWEAVSLGTDTGFDWGVRRGEEWLTGFDATRLRFDGEQKAETAASWENEKPKIEAKKRLDAAASALLEAAENALGVLEYVQVYMPYGEGSLGEADLNDGVKRLAAAIALAKGETNE